MIRAFLGAVLLAVPAFAADSTNNSSGSPDQQYLSRQASIAHYQIEAGKLAQERSQSDQIKQYANEQIQQSQKQLQQIEQAQKSTQSSQSPQPKSDEIQRNSNSRSDSNSNSHSGMSRTQSAMIEDLRQCQGSDFDREYAFSQAAIQRLQILQNEWEAKNGQSEQCKQIAKSNESESSQQKVAMIVSQFVNAGTAGSQQPSK